MAALIVSLVLSTATALPVGAAGSTPGVQAAPPAPATTALCGPAAPGFASCMSLRRADIAPLAAALVTPLSTPSGYGPAGLQSAYALTAAAATRGAGLTVAVVDAFDLPTAEADLATYRSQFGLPACTTANGCFRKVDQNGGTNYPTANTGWGGEIALDIDMVSAVCPNCNILLVEASSASIANLGTAVNEAAALGAVAISNSYLGSEFSGESAYDTAYYNHPGIAVTASSGDNGYGVGYPASSPGVIAVGGTSLATAANARGWTETAWSGAGSGCSAYESKPAWQHDAGCSRRTVADVSAVADPGTGVAVFSAGQNGWVVFGGTSVSSPIIASTYALAGVPAAGTYPGSYLYAASSASLNDVTSGSSGSCSGSYFCTAGVGYDGPTGLGTPAGTAAFTPPNNFSISASPGSLSVVQGSSGGSTISTALVSGSAESVALAASGLPAGVTASFSPASVTAGGSSTLTLTASGSATLGGPVTVTITGTAASATHTTSVALTVTAPVTNVIVNGGFETGDFTGWTRTGTTAIVTGLVHSGIHAERGGTTAPTAGDSSVSQTFTVPAAGGTLSFWYRVACLDTVTYGWATATLRDNVTSTTTTPLAHTCTNTGAWVQVSLNLAAQAGHSVTLTLTNHDDNFRGDPTYTLFDDVMLQ